MSPKEITRTQPTMDATPAGQVHQPFVQPARAEDLEAGHASGGEQGELRAPAAPGDAPPPPTGKPPITPTPSKQLPADSQPKAVDKEHASQSNSSKQPDKTSSKSKPSHHSGGEQETIPKTKPTNTHQSISKHTVNSQDTVTAAVQKAEALTKTALAAAEAHAAAAAEVEKQQALIPKASTEFLEAEAAAQATAPEDVSASLRHMATVNLRAAQNKSTAAHLVVKAARQAEETAALAAQQAMQEAHLAQETADQLIATRRQHMKDTTPPGTKATPTPKPPTGHIP
jgi:hypothetical protein